MLERPSKGDLYDEIGNKFGYVVERGNPVLVKLLEEGEDE